MPSAIENKLYGMYWDMQPAVRTRLVRKIIDNPADALHDDGVLLRALTSLGWYDLIQLTGPELLLNLLNDGIIGRIYPEGRRMYYTNAKRLLSKYTLSASGQST